MRTLLTILASTALAGAAAEPGPLAGTAPLRETGDFSARMVAGIGTWLDRETAGAGGARDRVWTEAANGSDWTAFAEKKRERLRQMIGAVDPREPGTMEEVSDAGAAPAAPLRTEFSVHRVRWPVFANVHGEGLLLRPTGAPRAVVIVIPEADEPPESSTLAPQLAAQGCLVLVPVLVDRRDTWSGSEALQRFTNQPHREWIHRQAFEMGRTLIGYEVQKILAGLDSLLDPRSKLQAAALPIGLAGNGEGGLLALHCGALDARFSTTLVSGYFGPRERLAAEPIYRTVFGLLREFGDAEIATLFAPRRLFVEASAAPEIAGPPPATPGRTGAAPGAITTPPLAAVTAEVARANALHANVRIIDSAERAREFITGLGLEMRAGTAPNGKIEAAPELTDARQHRTVVELEAFTQALMREAERSRNAAILAKAKPGPEWDAVQRELRARLANEAIGKLPPERLPPNPRSRVVRDEPGWVGYEVTLDVLPEVFAWGWLLVPRDLKPGERRPVVVCQHGLEGVPEDVVTLDEKTRAFGYYKGFATRLVEQGFIVFAPHNPYRGKDEFRLLVRRANPLGLSLFSFIVAQHEVITDWLAGLPFVDPARIGFYGLSYGGKTAMRVPALVPRYCLSICSGDFNEWIYKIAGTDLRMSYMFSAEWEMWEWNLAFIANYAEMALLIAPRPFMVERGHDDGVGLDEWVGYEYAKVRRSYDQLGIGERTEIDWFDGPHTIHAVATFDFLHRHLAWPGR